MLGIQGEPLPFIFHFTEDGDDKTGLTVTANVYRLAKADMAKTDLVTDGSCVEVASGLYRYLLASGSNNADGVYVARGRTASADVDQQSIPALWLIGYGNLASIAEILTDTATTIPTTLSGLAPAGEYDTELDTTISSRAPASEYDTELDATISSRAPANEYDTQLDANMSSRAPAGEYDTELGTTIPDAIAAIDTDSVMDAVVDDDNTFKEVMQFVASALFGLLSGGGTDTLTFRDLGDNLNRIVATVDSSGNRTVITLTKDS